jgi:hypothetical protein
VRGHLWVDTRVVIRIPRQGIGYRPALAAAAQSIVVSVANVLRNRGEASSRNAHLRRESGVNCNPLPPYLGPLPRSIQSTCRGLPLSQCGTKIPWTE